MTAENTRERTAKPIDFTMMYVTHDAFRRDLGRFKTASVAGTAHSPRARAGWENLLEHPRTGRPGRADCALHRSGRP